MLQLLKQMNSPIAERALWILPEFEVEAKFRPTVTSKSVVRDSVLSVAALVVFKVVSLGAERT
jgi:hypothetical protein